MKIVGIYLPETNFRSTQPWRESPNKDINLPPILELLTSRPTNTTDRKAQTGTCNQRSSNEWRPE